MTKTKCSVIGQKEVSKEKKSVEFCNYLSEGIDARFREEAYVKPSEWDNIIYLCERSGRDYMYAWDNGDEQNGFIYQGHWNDGVVE